MKMLLRTAVGLTVVGLCTVAPARAQGVPEGATKEMVDKGNEIFHKQGSATPATARTGRVSSART